MTLSWAIGSNRGSPNRCLGVRGAFLEEVTPRFRFEGPAKISQIMGEGMESMFEGVLGTEVPEHNLGDKSRHGLLYDRRKRGVLLWRLR